MGDETPDPVQIRCPGCDSRFKLTPKKGRLPSGDIPCPKCFEEIPVEDGEVVTDEETGDDGESAPGFGVVSPPDQEASDDSRDDQTGELDADEQQAVEQLEEMADDLPSRSENKSTMAGLPGVGRNPGDNPFKSDDGDDKTAAIDEDMLRRVAEESSVADDDDADDDDADDDRSSTSFRNRDNLPDTSPRLVDGDHAEQLAAEDSTAADSTEDLPDTGDDARNLRDTSEHDSAASKLRETAENPSVPGKSVSPADDADDTDQSDSEPQAAGVLGKIKKKQVRKRDLDDDSDQSDSSDGPSLPRPASTKSSDDESSRRRTRETTEHDTVSTDNDSSDDDSSLSNLFKKVRERRGSNKEELRDKLDSSASEQLQDTSEQELSDLADEVDISQEELEDLVDDSDAELASSAGDDDPELPTPVDDDSDSDPPTTPKADVPVPETPDDEASSEQTTDHSGLFEGVDSPAEQQQAPESAVQEVSDDTRKQRTQSAIARLKKDGDDAVEMGAAGEKRGSGYIRLPTDEIQDVLGQGDFRLKIEGVVYEPVDKKGLIKLIKGGVLLGAEEIAEASGDWMPISEHPVFGELRRKMASEAHDVLSKLGARDRPEESTADDAEARVEVDQQDDTDETSPGDDDSSQPAILQPRSPSPRKASSPSETDDAEETETAVEAGEPEETEETEEPRATDEPEQTDNSVDAEELEETEEPPDTQTTTPTKQQFEADIPDSDPEPVESPPLPDTSPSPTESPEDSSPPDDQPSKSPDVAPSSESDVSAAEPDDRHAGDADDEATFAELDTAPQQADDAEPPTARPPASESRGTPTALIAGAGLGVALLAVAGGLLLTAPGQEILDDTVGWSPADEQTQQPTGQAEDHEPDVAEQLDGALAAASDDLVDAIPEAADATEDDAWVDHHLEQGEIDRASEVMYGQFEEGRRDRDFLLEFAETLHEQGHYRRARRVALTGVSEFPDDDAFIDTHRRAVEDDERLYTYEFTELTDPTDFRADGLYDVADHRGIILERADERFLFKPRRDGQNMQWRAEIASARFCELVVCHFEVLDIGPALATREFFEDLDADSDLQALAAEASWESIEIDGEQVEAVRGSLETIPDSRPAAFPIEYRPLWRDWLTAGSATDFAAASLVDTIDTLEDLDDGRFHQNLADAAGDVPTGRLARSVSSLLMFDYLTNNWERFATRTEDYGRNNPVGDASLISRHNGHAFQPRASRRVRERFEWTSRFSASTVSTVRALDRETTYEVLFPRQTTGEQRRLDVMWDQRDEMLDRVDELVSRHGRDDVLLFD